MTAAAPLLAVDRLSVNFATSRVVDRVSFEVAAGEKFALVGESGSGKSVTALSVLRLLETASYEGAIRFAGEDVLAKSERQMEAMRGRDVAMIFQEPMTALNPVYTIGNQLEEAYRRHKSAGQGAARERSVYLLEKGRDHGSGGTPAPISAPAVGRAPPARHDCDGAHVRPSADHRRRADDGA